MLEVSFSSIRIKQVNMFVIDMQLETAANMGVRSWIEPGKDSLTAGGQIHQQFTAQVLDNINSSVEG